MTASVRTSIAPRHRRIDGLQIRFADTGGGPQDPTVLLTSPWPESLYAFAPMWTTLAERARLFAVDLPGFGASERREHLLSLSSDGWVLDQTHRGGRSGSATYGLPRHRDIGRSVRRGGTSRVHRKRHRRHGRSCGTDRAR
jgi:pimeloyl-ACP methyl ester carboxylesterase